MMRRRGITMFLCPNIKCNLLSRTTLLGAIIVLLGFPKIRADYKMGGHLDNNDEQKYPIMEHRSDDDAGKTSIVSSRTASLEELDRDFDLELDLLAEQSAVDPTRVSINSSGSLSSSSSLDDEASMSEESEAAPRYRVHPYAFNGGHPFSLEKDPITGQIDFAKAPPLKALEYSVEASSPIDETSSETSESGIETKIQREDTSLGPNEINPYSPSFHDFLNLPIRYTYDKYDNSEKYPLISSSYANTKVQSGGNSYNTYNHKKYHEAVKAGVDITTLYVQPSRKTYPQSSTKSTTTGRSNATTSEPNITKTTSPRTTTVKKSIIVATATTTIAPSATTKRSATTQRSSARYPAVTTWKPQRKPSEIYGIYDDYEATLPIERLQQGISEKQTSTEKSLSVVPASRPSEPEKIEPNSEENKNEEYEEGYDEDYEHILQIAGRPPVSQDNESNVSQDDYTYGVMDLIGDPRPVAKSNATSSTSSATTKTTSFAFTNDATTTTVRPSTISWTRNDSTTVVTRESEIGTTSTGPSVMEQKRVTSMPIDTIANNDDNYRVTVTNYGHNVPIVGTFDNSIPSVTSNNVIYQQQNRPSNNENYYPRPPMIGMTSGGYVVKSTSNVVVPPGQDTVSFVLGNRQSVGSVSDAGSEFYGISSSENSKDRSTISFGKIGNSRPSGPTDNFSGQMIVSAGIGVGNNPIVSYNQRPSTSPNNYDHAVVTIGMPTVDIVNPGESGATKNSNDRSTKRPDSSTNSLDTLAQKWWASTSAGTFNGQQESSKDPQESTNQRFDHRIIFPDEKGHVAGFKGTNENSSGIQRPIEEHVIVVHESDIGNGNTLRLDLSTQGTTGPTTNYHYETTTQRLIGNTEDKPLPELSESLTPPAERPNVSPSGNQGIQLPSSYNYYNHHHHHHQHQSHSTGNPRPNDYQRLPSSQNAASSNGFKRRPPSSTIDANLPNILPQFRPNAKTSHGHNRGETIGTIPAGPVPLYANTRIRRPPAHLNNHHHHHHHQQQQHHHRPAISRRPSGPPSHLQRLNPPPLLPPPPPPITSLRLPTPAPLIGSPSLGLTNQQQQQQQHDSTSQQSSNDNSVRLGGSNRLHKVSIGAPPSLAIDERHHQSNGFGQRIKSRLEDDDSERFSAEPPSRPPYFTKRTTSGEQLPDGMPRIATLQMIQQHGGSRDSDEAVARPNLAPPYGFDDEKNSSKRQEIRDNERIPATEENSPSSPNGNDEKLENSRRGNEGTRADYVDEIDSPVYVVYPVKGAMDIRSGSNEENDQDDASVVLGTYGSQRPLPPDTLLQDSNDNGNDEDEESGSVIGINENTYGSPNIMNVSPSFMDSSAPQLASDFPYPLERPDPSLFTSQLREKPLLVPSENQKNAQRSESETSEEIITSAADVNRDIERDASVNVIPYLQDHVPFALKENAGVISATLQRLGSSIVGASSTPIAYVYTPTAGTPMRNHEDPYVEASFERGTVLLPSQQPSSSSSSAPSPQSFMAPFVASASAEAPTKNGWSVVMMGQSPSDASTSSEQRRHDTIIHANEAKQTSNADNDGAKIEADSDNDDDDNNERIMEVTKSTEMETTKAEETDVQTEKSEFDVENFTPQLFGGFKPIFEFPSDAEHDPRMGDRVSGDSDGAMVERPRSESV